MTYLAETSTKKKHPGVALSPLLLSSVLCTPLQLPNPAWTFRESAIISHLSDGLEGSTLHPLDRYPTIICLSNKMAYRHF